MKSLNDPYPLLGAHGPLAEQLTNFAPRLAQQHMAQAVSEAIAHQQTLVCEAATGIGKTFAYLIPAIMSGAKIIVATGTKNLQDQLIKRDLPFLIKTLKQPVRYRVLKGRANYLCHYRFQQLQESSAFLADDTLNLIQDITAWQQQTHSGELNELQRLNEQHPIFASLVSSADNCLGQDCQFIEDCFIAKARRRAQTAEILVINHHLFFADLVLQDDGLGELLPKADAIIIDEAHQLPVIGQQYFGKRLSSKQIRLLCKDCLAESALIACDHPALQTICQQIEQQLKALQAVFGLQQQRRAWRDYANHSEVVTAGNALVDALQDLQLFLQGVQTQNKVLEQCCQRSYQLAVLLAELLPLNEQASVQWLEVNRQQFMLQRTPLSISDAFSRLLYQEPKACIFTSATLSVNQNFQHFTSNLGLTNDSKELSLKSPFNYQQQALLYIPQHLPEPQHPQFTDAVIEQALPVLKASHGRAFMLFTSYAALYRAAKLLSPHGFNLFIQGDQPKLTLLEQFSRTPNSILLGTSSFWQGVDVRGEALSCVIIDKLPFASPGDPVTAAKIKALQQQGKNAFSDYQLPQAIIQLKQGAGRLIRDSQDRGVLMICDNRLFSKAYGKQFLQSLPDMPLSRKLTEVNQFFQHNSIGASA